MIRIFSIAAAVVVLAASAQAQTVTVKVAGKDAATLHRDIVRAAYQVCSDTIGATPLAHEMIPSCVHQSVVRAEAQLNGSTLAAATAHGKDASTVAAR
jgi:hypothetical protein